jgi:hypothetical protein
LANFKGTVFQSTRLFTEREFGADAVGKILGNLSVEDRTVLADVQAIGWYPVEPVLRYHRELDRLFGKGDLSLCFRAGRFSASWSMNTVLKVFLRFTSPVWLIDKTTRVWDRYHDSGRWEVKSLAPNRMVGELHDFAVRDPAFCARLRGWLHGAVEMTGGTNPTINETRCVCRGDGHCVFALTWPA